MSGSAHGTEAHHSASIPSLAQYELQRDVLTPEMLEAWYHAAPTSLHTRVKEILHGEPQIIENEHHRMLIAHLYLQHCDDAIAAEEIYEEADPAHIGALQAFVHHAVLDDEGAIDLNNPHNRHALTEAVMPNGRLHEIFDEVYVNQLIEPPPTRGDVAIPSVDNLTRIFLRAPGAAPSKTFKPDVEVPKLSDFVRFLATPPGRSTARLEDLFVRQLIILQVAVDYYAIPAAELPSWYANINSFITDPAQARALGPSFTTELNRLIAAITSRMSGPATAAKPTDAFETEQLNFRTALHTLRRAVGRYNVPISPTEYPWFSKIDAILQDHTQAPPLEDFTHDVEKLTTALELAKAKEAKERTEKLAKRVLRRPLEGSEVTFLLIQQEHKISGGGGPTRLPAKTAGDTVRFALMSLGRNVDPSLDEEVEEKEGGLLASARSSVGGFLSKGFDAAADLGRMTLSKVLEDFPVCKDIDLGKSGHDLEHDIDHALSKVDIKGLIYLMIYLRHLGTTAREGNRSDGIMAKDLRKTDTFVRALETMISNKLRDEILSHGEAACDKVPHVLEDRLFKPVAELHHSIGHVEGALAAIKAPEGHHAHGKKSFFDSSTPAGALKTALLALAGSALAILTDDVAQAAHKKAHPEHGKDGTNGNNHGNGHDEGHHGH